MNASPLVTIAIPTHNRAATYFPPALRSALAQTYDNVEVIVADNCSSDDTQRYVASVGDGRVRYFRHERVIAANDNFNFCVEQSKGRFLSLLHDDDLIDPDFVAACMHAARDQSDVGIIRTGTRLIDSQAGVLHEFPNHVSGLTTEDFFRAWFAGNTAIYACSTLFNTERLKETGGFKSKHNCYQDAMAVMLLAAKHGRVDVPGVKASVRIHSAEMVGKRRISEWCEDSLMLIDKICALASTHKAEIRKEGLAFLARANYRRAGLKTSVIHRWINYFHVMRYFNYRYLPSPSLLLHTLQGTALYDSARFVKRSLRHVSSGV
jgi:glycosyltransferase involved in cell wall biosynthesis